MGKIVGVGKHIFGGPVARAPSSTEGRLRSAPPPPPHTQTITCAHVHTTALGPSLPRASSPIAILPHLSPKPLWCSLPIPALPCTVCTGYWSGWWSRRGPSHPLVLPRGRVGSRGALRCHESTLWLLGPGGAQEVQGRDKKARAARALGEHRVLDRVSPHPPPPQNSSPLTDSER